MFFDNLGQFFWYWFPQILIYFKRIKQSILGIYIIYFFTCNVTNKGLYITIYFLNFVKGGCIFISLRKAVDVKGTSDTLVYPAFVYLGGDCISSLIS